VDHLLLEIKRCVVISGETSIPAGYLGATEVCVRERNPLGQFMRIVMRWTTPLEILRFAPTRNLSTDM
jgi:hypothetical protein